MKEKLEVAQPKSGTYAINHRTWGARAYIIYWVTGGQRPLPLPRPNPPQRISRVAGFAIYNYSTGSALITYGLSGPQALAAGIFSPIALAVLCVFCGWIGGSHHVTYTVASRMSWGMRGTWFAVAIRVMPGLVWDGIEAWWGGQAVSTCIGSMSLWWARWSYPLADGTMELKVCLVRVAIWGQVWGFHRVYVHSSPVRIDCVGLTTFDLCKVLIYYFVYLCVMWLPPERLQAPFRVSVVGFSMVVVGLLIWALKHSHSGGPYFSHDYEPDAILASSLGWAVVWGATSVLGNVGVVTLGQADWCRFSRDGNTTPMIAQAIACPIAIYLAYALGILVTSASAETLGDAYWQPYLLLRKIQEYHGNSSSSRAAVFFASAACAFAQVCVNVILNSVASAMDLTSYSPKYLNIRRGAYLIAAIGIAVNPWQLTVNAATFIAVLNGFGIFYGPCSGILVADFWIVRKRLVKLDDLYLGDPKSIYWYWHGVNWRAVIAFVVAIWPAMPGYVMGCANLHREPNAWMKLSRLGFLTGFFIAVLVYWGLNKIWPSPGLGVGTRRHDEDTLVLPSAYRQDIPSQGRYSVPLDGVAQDEDDCVTPAGELAIDGKEKAIVSVR
ncbi:ncs1 nucleoside transporter family protein [Teratosphaeria destructans]|uniref:Ncs1 nucleoside transporter family protein n=1 Tax=Teratosphaeria destructans TaxID=418781 RepID=A0A9W7T0A9_9PEZI|nr:ncs1 nucleoside transporter family protein [Teratosphaeria destructans]